MARIIGKKPQFVDELEQAERNIERLREQLETTLSIPNTDVTAYIDDVVPMVPTVDTTKTLVDKTIASGEPVEQYRTLYGQSDSMFKTRADYERTRRYVNRINKAAESDWSSEDTYALGGIGSQLTAVREVNGTVQSEFMRRESTLAARNTNKKVIESLKEQGINMVKVPVMKLDEETGELKQMYDRNRHPVYQYLPETPDMNRRYQYLMQSNPTKRVVQPDVPTNGVMFQWGDAVLVEEKKAKPIQPKKIVHDLTYDENIADTDILYIENFKDILASTLPSGVYDKFAEVFDDITSLDTEDIRDIVDRITHMGVADGIDAIEYFYREAGQGASQKLTDLTEGLMDAVSDYLDISDYEVFEYLDAESWEEELGDSMLTDGQNIYQMYQRAKGEGRSHSLTLQQMRDLRG